MEKGVVPVGGDDAPGDGQELVLKKVGDQPQVRRKPKFLYREPDTFGWYRVCGRTSPSDGLL
jgi:hypothetical protein